MVPHCEARDPHSSPRPHHGVIVACVARPVQAKRIDRFLRVLAAAVELPGGLRPRRWSSRRRRDVYALLRAADIFLLTSNHEELPNVLLEVMAAGLPAAAEDAVATRIAELARSPRCGAS